MSGDISASGLGFVPTATRNAAGFISVDWPDNAPATTVIHRELLLSLVDDMNRLAAERALADQLADALRTVRHDRPSAHTDNMWAVINHALITYKEARK